METEQGTAITEQQVDTAAIALARVLGAHKRLKAARTAWSSTRRGSRAETQAAWALDDAQVELERALEELAAATREVGATLEAEPS